MNRVKQAKEFAREKHDGITRKDGVTPYFDHLKKVVKNLEKLGTPIMIYSVQDGYMIQ